MKKFYFVSIALAFIASCASETPQYENELPYNRLAAHIRVAEQTQHYVVYDYSNVRIDEVAPIAAIYCHEHADKQASLSSIEMRPDHRRRALFVCQ
jgi:hypothetical protein